MKNVPLKSVSRSKVGSFLMTAMALGLGITSIQAEDVFVTSYKGTTATADVMPNPPFLATGHSAFGAGTTSASAASPVPVIPSTGRRVVYGNATSATWSVTPTDITVTGGGAPAAGYTFSQLQHLGTYKIYVTKGSGATTHSTNLVMSMTAVGGTLADTNGVGQASVAVPFRRALPSDVWLFAGYITNTTPNPTVTFSVLSGSVDGTGNRWNMDAVRFQYIDTCTPDGAPPVAPQPSVTGPLVQGQTTVNVSGIVAGATNVSVFSAGNPATLLGETNFAGGFAAGSVVVPTTALIKDDVIVAMQQKTGCSNQLAGAGPFVGGGANPFALNVMMSFSKNAGLTGPAGTNGTLGTGFPYIMKADRLIGGFGTAPTPGQPLGAVACWQTVTFDPFVDLSVDQNGGTTVPQNTDPYAALEGLVFGMSGDALDSGPYDIYVDSIMNGETVIEDFESYAEGSVGTFVAANGATQPSPSVYLSGTVSSTISTNNAFSGTKSCRIRWQWSDNAVGRWAKVLARGTGGGKVYPQVSTTNTITIRYLIVPVGETTDKLHFTSSSHFAAAGTDAVLSAGAIGNGPFTYQWSFAGTDIPDATGSTYTKANVQAADAGLYSVFVTGSSCNTTNAIILTVGVIPTAPSGLTATAAGSSQINLSWTDNSGDESGFIVARSTTSGGPYSNIATVAANTTTYNNTGLTANTTYYYVVRARGTGADSADSAQASATTAPLAVTLTHSVNSAAKTVTLNWTGAGWILQQATSLGSPTVWTDVSPQPTGNSYTNSTATPGTKYFRLKQ